MATFEPETPVTVYHNKPVFNSKIKAEEINSQMGLIVDSLLRSCFKSLSSDNLSLILICFENFKKLWENANLEKNADKLKGTKNSSIINYTLKHQFSPVRKPNSNFSKKYSKSTLIGNSSLNISCN